MPGDTINSRKPLFYNNDVIISKSHIDKSMDYYFRNGHYDELWYIQNGTGTLITNYGNITFGFGIILLFLEVLFGS